MQTKELYSSGFIRLVGGGGGGDLDPEIRGNPVSKILFCPAHLAQRVRGIKQKK